MNLLKCIYYKFLSYMTPIKITAICIVFLVSFTYVTNPIYHGTVGEQVVSISVSELLMKSLFLFFALFSLFGNGRTVKIRLILVMIPMLYYNISYAVRFLQTNTQNLLVPIILLSVYSLWVFLTGEHYSHANKRYFDSGISDFNRICAELDSKTFRQE